MRHIQLYSLVDRRHRRKTVRAQSLRRRSTRTMLGGCALILLVLMVGLLSIGLIYTNLVSDLPSLSLLPDLLTSTNAPLMQPTRIYDRTGEHLLLSLENPGISRRYLSLDPNKPDHLSPELVRTTVGLLDPGYWQGPGFSLAHLTSQQPVTIAERLADDLLLWREPQGPRRALRMRILAAQMIATYGRVQVLEWYLNSANYGHLAFGADSAARLYLNKSAAGVDLSEAVLLITASQAPALNPLDAPTTALERQHAALDQLLVQGTITKAEYDHFAARKLNLAQAPGEDASPAPAFSQVVLDQLSERIERRRLERGGLRVITTLDYGLQLELSCLVRTQLERLTEEPLAEAAHPDGSPCPSVRLLPTISLGNEMLSKDLTASAVLMDPKNGQVLALLGDTSANGEKAFLAARQPGSALTPFVAVAGFARGFSPSSLSWDIPASLPESMASLANPDGKFHGPVRLRTAIANDYLAPQAQFLAQIGASNIWRLVSAFGLQTLSDETSPDLIYQGGQVSPLEMAQAYSIFANQGERYGQRLTAGGSLHSALILYVESLDGSIWFDAQQPESETVVSAQLAYLVHHVLSDNTARWPSLGSPNALEIGRPAGAKVGQVESGREVWAAGYTPQRVAVFWLGQAGDNADKKSPASESRLNPKYAAGMWHALMQYVSRDQPVEDWSEPAGISHLNVCDPSGLLPTSACPDVVSEVFLNGAEPTGVDSLYQTIQINRETGLLATVFTPPALIEEKTYLVVPSQARTWAQVAGLSLPPTEYDAIQLGTPSVDVRITSPALFAYVHGEVIISGSAAGDGFRFYQVQVGQGLNPQSWLQVGDDGSAAVKEGPLAVWNTTGQDGLYAVRLQVVRQNQMVETSTIQVTVDNIAPAVRIPYPGNAQEFTLPQDRTITFQAEASDAIGIQRLVWLVDGQQVGENLQPPYILTWQASRGLHTLESRAYDLAGNEGRSETINFTVK